MDCLSDETLLSLVEGGLAGPAKDAADQHVAGCARCAKRIASASDGQDEPGATADAGERIAPGMRIGRYLVQGPIGVGGMGVVYAARDPDLRRTVAIKLIRGELGGDGSRAMMQREAQAMARLSHPNVVPVFEIGEADGRLFLVMELVEGQTLAQWLKERPRAVGEVLEKFLEAGEGLAAAHAAGVIHRDFKPENVLVGKDGRARVSDFGLARGALHEGRSAPDLDRAPGASSASEAAAPGALTPIGALLGTPAYMSPEQMDGLPASAASDLFAFCTALYEALCGVRPFAGRTLYEIRGAIREGRFTEAPRDRKVPRWLYRLAQSGLAADPAARPASMKALLAELRADPQRRRRRLLGAALLALVAAGAGVLLHWAAAARAASCAGEAAIIETAWSPGRREAMRARFEQSGIAYAGASFAAASALLDEYAGAWSAMRTSACEATRVRREQPEEVFALRAACLDRQRGELGALTDLFLRADKKIIEHAVAAVNALGELEECDNVTALAAPLPPPRDPALKARLDAALAKIEEAAAQWRLGVVTKATLALAAPALEEIRAVGHAPSMAYAELMVGRIEGRLGNHQRAEELCADGLYDGTRGRETREVIHALQCLTQMVGLFGGRTDEGLRYGRLALATIEGFDNRERDIVDLKTIRSLVLLNAGRLDEALADRRAGIAACDRQSGADSAPCLEGRSNAGVILTSQGRIEEARAVFAQVVPGLEKLLGVGHPQTLLAKANLGSALLMLGRNDEAASILEQTVKNVGAAFGEHGIYFATELVNLGELRLARGQAAEGLEIEQRAIAIMEAISPQHPGLCEPLTQAGLALIALGRAAESLPLLERALAISKDGSAATDVARIQFALARALIALRREHERSSELTAAGRKAFAEAAAHWGGENARLADQLAPPIQ